MRRSPAATTIRSHRSSLGCFGLALYCGLSLLFRCGAAGHTPTNHPFLFLTTNDVARARQSIASQPDLMRMAAELIEKADAIQTARLPELDPAWWHALTNRPWRDCYPENHHHTLALPLQWASAARDCARASLLAGNGRPLARKARQILLGLSDYSFAWDHYDTGMFYTIWAAQALEAYDILYHELTPEDHTRLDAFFERCLRAVQRNDAYWIQHEPGGKLNNHYAWHKLGLMMIGLFYHRNDLVHQALHGPKGVHHLMAAGFKDNGLWMEGAIPYQITTTVPLVMMAEMLENAGYPERLWQQPFNRTLDLKRTYDALFTTLFPDGTVPPIGDSYARRPHLGDVGDLEIIARRFNDPACAWLLSQRPRRPAHALFFGLPRLPQAQVPPQPSRLWPEMGYAALRSREGPAYWSGNAWTAFAAFSAMPVHEHADKLSLMLFGGGHLWLPDCEAKSSAEHAFSSLVQSQLNRQTICHNTLLVDGGSQRFPSHRLEWIEFDPHAAIKRLTIADTSGQLYDGVTQMRTLLVSEDCVLDLFQVRSATPRDYAWMVHVDGASASASMTNWTAAAFPTNPPWNWLRAPRRAPAGTRYTETFRHGTGTLRLDLLADGPIEIVQCAFPRDDTPDGPTLPMRIARCRRPEAWFLALYRLSPASGDLNISLLDQTPSVRTVVIETRGKREEHRAPRLSAAPPDPVRLNEVQRRALVLQAMTDVMGPPPLVPDRALPPVQVLDTNISSGIIRHRITFHSPDGEPVPALLLLPAAAAGRLPAVLCLHQTTPVGKSEPGGLAGSSNLHYAAELAARGFVTLAPDYPNFGDYRLDAYQLGYASATMKGIVNHRTALSVLASLPQTDPGRLGVIGHSLGGHNALFLAAFDPRVKAVVTSCGFTSFRKYRGGNLAGWSHAGYMPRIATLYHGDPARMPFDFADILSLLAPRPLFINAPLHDDNFSVEGVRDCVDTARPEYARLQAPSHLVLETPDCGHDFPLDTRRRAYEFLTTHLKPN